MVGRYFEKVGCCGRRRSISMSDRQIKFMNRVLDAVAKGDLEKPCRSKVLIPVRSKREKRGL